MTLNSTDSGESLPIVSTLTKDVSQQPENGLPLGSSKLTSSFEQRALFMAAKIGAHEGLGTVWEETRRQYELCKDQKLLDLCDRYEAQYRKIVGVHPAARKELRAALRQVLALALNRDQTLDAWMHTDDA